MAKPATREEMFKKDLDKLLNQYKTMDKLILCRVLWNAVVRRGVKFEHVSVEGRYSAGPVSDGGMDPRRES